MYRERTYVCPVWLGDLDHESPECQDFLLRALATPGVRRISFVRRGGSQEPMIPRPDEAILIHESYGMFGRPREERWGADVQHVTEARILREEDAA